MSNVLGRMNQVWSMVISMQSLDLSNTSSIHDRIHLLWFSFSSSETLTVFPKIILSVADLRGGVRDARPPPSASKFFQFHAVFGRIGQNCVFTPPLEGSRPPPWGNPGSVTDYWLSYFWLLVASTWRLRWLSYPLVFNGRCNLHFIHNVCTLLINPHHALFHSGVIHSTNDFK